MPAKDSPAILPQPPDELKQLSRRLVKRMTSEVRAHGPMPFSRFMEMALYEPGLGYYSAGLHKLGEGGDFVTAPGLGTVFARCLARQVSGIAAELGRYAILEVGAGTGRLAVDLLSSLPETAYPERYMILERSADLRQVQMDTLKSELPGWSGRIVWLDEPPARDWQGVLLANEVIDALPVEMFCIEDDRVRQCAIGLADGQLATMTQPAPSALERRVQAIGERLDHSMGNGYQSEVCTLLAPWLSGLSAGMQRGCALFIDYGYPRREYYSAQRHMGTLICHYRHLGHDDPLFYPGLQDISAFVDFTALAEAGDAAGLECAGYTSQAMFLMGCGLDQVLAGMDSLADADRLALASEVRRLTLPSEMGEKFQVMALTREFTADLAGFSQLDLRYRL
jgi:SAM-dependent MidA family methyltransferase